LRKVSVGVLSLVLHIRKEVDSPEERLMRDAESMTCRGLLKNMSFILENL